jgi:hypothetical protein
MKNRYVFAVLSMLLSLGCGSRNAPGNRLVCADNLKQLALSVSAVEPLGRKMVYTANLQILVEEFEKAEVQLAKLAKEQKGFIAQSEITGASTAERTGKWTVRVPLDRFETFLEEAMKLGVSETNRVDSKTVLDSKDVTEEHADVDARVRNKKAEEARLLKHLDKSTNNLEEILAVEKQLTRVRGEIEEQQRRLRDLDNLVALATVHVTLRSVPAAEAQSSRTRVATAFHDSWASLRNAGTEILAGVAAAVPWLPVAGLIAAIALIILRRLRRHAVASAT